MHMNCYIFTVFTVHKNHIHILVPSNGHKMTSLSCIRQTLINPKTFMCKLSCLLVPLPQISSHRNGFVFYKHVITSAPNGYSKPLNEICTGLLFLKPRNKKTASVPMLLNYMQLSLEPGQPLIQLN
jgi:hypothetical protein